MNILIEALIVGVITAVVGLIVSYGVMYIEKPESVKNFDHWWSIVVSFFITGFLIHLLCEFSGVNRWYCVHGSACLAQGVTPLPQRV